MIPLLKVDHNTGNTLTIQNFFESLNSSYFLGDQVSGSTTLAVINGSLFTTANPYVVIGSFGSDTAELRSVSSSTATTVVVSSATSFAHAQGEPVHNVRYNQVVIESATSQGGSYSVLATASIDWTNSSTVYQHGAGTATTWYRVRFLNATATVYSDYSDEAASSSFGVTTAGYLIERARSQMGDTTGLTDSFFVGALNDARNLANTNFGYGRMNEWRQNFEYPIQMLAGRNFVTLPTNIDFDETNRTILNARYARQQVAANVPIMYVDKRRWNTVSYINRYAPTSGVTAISATSIVLTNSGDFPASGTVYAATDDPTQSILTITYTGNNLATNTLTGVSGVTRALPDGCQIWAYATFSYPFYFTVFDGKIWFERPIPTSLQGKNLYIDYYEKLADLEYLTDVVPEHYRNIYIDYIRFAIKKRRDNSIGEDDQDYKRFKDSINTMLGNPYTGQSQIIIT